MVFAFVAMHSGTAAVWGCFFLGSEQRNARKCREQANIHFSSCDITVQPPFSTCVSNLRVSDNWNTVCCPAEKH
jgi:hypothetical protein